jgi:hypothetical protein
MLVSKKDHTSVTTPYILTKPYTTQGLLRLPSPTLTHVSTPSPNTLCGVLGASVGAKYYTIHPFICCITCATKWVACASVSASA